MLGIIVASAPLCAQHQKSRMFEKVTLAEVYLADNPFDPVATGGHSIIQHQASQEREKDGTQ